MESVLSQTYKDFEYVVVDGASTDSSVDIIRASALQAEGLEITWISEPDTGIYNAMNKGIEIALGKRIVNSFNRSELVEDKNKGIRKASGEYILMLNSGDYLVDEYVLERIMPELHTDGVIQGGMYLYQMKEECLDYGNGLTDMSFYDVVKGDFLHQADFVRKDVYEQYGYYDESYRIAGDTVFFINVLGFHNVTFRNVQIPISFFEGGGAGSGKDEKWKAIQLHEIKRIENEILGPRLVKVFKEDYPKVQLYNTLYAHKWSWFLIKLIKRLIHIFHRK
jgi:glycosyltransferase involved in cell wall biosynthesis